MPATPQISISFCRSKRVNERRSDGEQTEARRVYPKWTTQRARWEVEHGARRRTDGGAKAKALGRGERRVVESKGPREERHRQHRREYTYHIHRIEGTLETIVERCTGNKTKLDKRREERAANRKQIVEIREQGSEEIASGEPENKDLL
jgi:hypothetical protein